MDPSDYYDMSHPKRGMALIFNHEFFANNSPPRRRGTIIDSNGLKSALSDLGFTVMVFHDHTLQLIKTRLSQVANMDHSKSDCLLVAALTHGEDGWLWAKDTEYRSELLWKQFSGELCPSLRGKPKIFVVQACRGSCVDEGVFMQTQVDGPGSEEQSWNRPDFLIARSTVPGYFSWRNPGTGSCFIQALVKQLREQGRELDFLTLLTNVNRVVAMGFESTSTVKQLNKKKAMPTIEFTLTRLLLLSDKKY